MKKNQNIQESKFVHVFITNITWLVITDYDIQIYEHVFKDIPALYFYFLVKAQLSI